MSAEAAIVGGLVEALLPTLIDAVSEGMTGKKALAAAVERMQEADPGPSIDDAMRASVAKHLARVRAGDP